MTYNEELRKLLRDTMDWHEVLYKQMLDTLLRDPIAHEKAWKRINENSAKMSGIHAALMLYERREKH